MSDLVENSKDHFSRVAALFMQTLFHYIHHLYLIVRAAPRENNLKTVKAGLEVIKLFLSSVQLSMKFKLLINGEIVKISGKIRFRP